MSKLSRLYRAANAVQEAAQTRKQQTPDVTQEAFDASDDLGNPGALVSAVAKAEDARDAVTEVRQVEDSVCDIRDVASTVNDAGGLTMESLVFATLALEQQVKRLGIPMPELGVSFESFENPQERKTISLEGIDELIALVKKGGTELEKRSVQAIHAVYDALKDSLPQSKRRLEELGKCLEGAKIAAGAEVQVGDGIVQMLGVEGKLPEDLAGYLARYVAYGEALVGVYNEAALEAATKASKFSGSLDLEDVGNFWQSVTDQVNAIGNPRTKLTDDQLNFALPGGGPLFGGVVKDVEGDNPAIKAMRVFSENRAPLDPMFEEVVEETTDSAEEPAATTADSVPAADAPVDTAATPEGGADAAADATDDIADTDLDPDTAIDEAETADTGEGEGEVAKDKTDAAETIDDALDDAEDEASEEIADARSEGKADEVEDTLDAESEKLEEATGEETKPEEEEEEEEAEGEEGNSNESLSLEGDTAETAPALTVTAIRSSCDSLCAVHDRIQLSDLLDHGNAAWTDSSAAVRQTRNAIDNAPETVQAEIRDDVEVITNYLDTVYVLSAWPVLHFLTNLVLSTNAFVLFAQRSLKAGEAASDQVEETATDDSAAEAPAETETVAEEEPVVPEKPAEPESSEPKAEEEPAALADEPADAVE